MLKIFIGYDPRESIAFHVLVNSILKRASRPVLISPIMLSQLPMYKRERSPDQSTDFTYARFLTPYLAGSGTSVFMDCDMLCLADINELEDLAVSNPHHDVLVVKHDYEPKTETKFLGAKQTKYPCKNWSSLMVFNGHRMAVKDLTADYVNTASPMDLHQFKWARSVGELPKEWNHLVGEYPPNPKAKILHFTLGGPWFKKDTESADEWFREMI